jgi:hypothetical protein
MAWLGVMLIITPSLASGGWCPFCPPSQPTLAEYLSTSDAAVLVQWKASQGNAEQQTATTDLAIVDVLKGDAENWKKGTTIVLPYTRDGQPGDLFLLMGTLEQKGDLATASWSVVQEINETLYGYIRRAPGIERGSAERLTFYLPYLEAADPEIANDTFAEFSRASYVDVSSLKPRFHREKLREWVRSEQVLAVRKGLYAMMLGLCGEPEDAAWLKHEILRPVKPEETRLGIDGMMAGYVLLTGRQGLEEICQAKLDDLQTPPSEVYATVNLLRFLWEERPLPLTDDELRSQMRKLLKRNDLSEVAVVDLARWKDWSIWPKLRDQWGRGPFASFSGKQKLVQFAKAMLKDATWGDAESRQDVARFLEGHRLDQPGTLPLPAPENTTPR